MNRSGAALDRRGPGSRRPRIDAALVDAALVDG
ncbi:hypothetical protein HDA42_001089 [Streptomyces costaricanus]|uniref:Uncharacterized protein n=1 Tax=Streptomyces murinus TaxID=33900 RepID=A0A7W3NK12_STRMR|nr:hypothetical protein [Streptomyces murinus]